MFFTRNKRIYLDYASATPLSLRVWERMEEVKDVYGNPSSVHGEGTEAKKLLKESRDSIGKTLLLSSSELIFTSGGTESNNLAILGVVRKALAEGGSAHAVTTAIEHPSVLECFFELEREGAEVTYLPVDKEGKVSVEDVRNAVKEETVLVSVMYANGEVGVIEPIRDIARALSELKKVKAREKTNGKAKRKGWNFVFHTDASQAPLFLSVNGLGADLITLDAAKLYGPKGIGLLYKNHNVSLSPLFYGGGQEGTLRPGTENLLLVAGFSEALKEVEEKKKEHKRHAEKLQKYFYNLLERDIPEAGINGSKKQRLPNNVNISLVRNGKGIDAEFLVVRLDRKGIACGTRSACQGREEGISYVLTALGKNREESKSSLRFSFGKETRKEDIEKTVSTIRELLDTPLEVGE
ncbi:MAG: cysteine desulfurase family protein [Candidatus Paceibacterota bacterium]